MLSHRLRRAAGQSSSISFVNAIAGNNTNGNDVTLSLTGLGLQEDDIVIMTGGHPRGSTAPSTPSGFTEIINPTGLSSTSCGAWYKIMGASPDTSVTGSGSGNSNDAEGYIALAFRGVDTTTPIDATATYTEDDSDSTSPDNPSITTVTNNAMVLAIAGGRIDDSSITAPSGYAAVTDGVLFTHTTDSRDFTMAASYRTVPSTGAEDPAGWTNWTICRWLALTVALRPA